MPKIASQQIGPGLFMTKNQEELVACTPSLAGKKVLLLFPHMVTPGGALIYTLHLAAQLREAGARVAILTLKASDCEAKVPDGVDVISIKWPPDIKCFLLAVLPLLASQD